MKWKEGRERRGAGNYSSQNENVDGRVEEERKPMNAKTRSSSRAPEKFISCHCALLLSNDLHFDESLRSASVTSSSSSSHLPLRLIEDDALSRWRFGLFACCDRVLFMPSLLDRVRNIRQFFSQHDKLCFSCSPSPFESLHNEISAFSFLGIFFFLLLDCFNYETESTLLNK